MTTHHQPDAPQQQKIAYAVELRASKAGLWRGVIDLAHTKNGSLGPYISGQRIWRCPHEHRSAGLAQTCAHRHLRTTERNEP